MTSVRPLVPRADLRAVLTEEARRALDDMVAVLAAGATTLARVFPAAARRTARGDMAAGGARIEDAVRVELVGSAATRLDPDALLDELAQLYRYGDADEKRAVLLALGGIDDPHVDGSALLLDALRTNDVRLVAAAMGPHAEPAVAARLAPRRAQVPLRRRPACAGVADLAARADAELAAMVRRYIDEREAAGRPGAATTRPSCAT